ncbi:MAG: alanine racemase [Synergistaceae bacterium]|jgi:alanine racemase|nr:alanine racemase [Synergistaceae bacterium]
MELLRPTRMEIASENLRVNYRNIKKFVGPGCEVFGIVKANAYSLGLAQVAKILREEGCRWFGVAIPEEALALRDAGFEENILVMGASPRNAADALVSNGIVSSCGDLDFAEALRSASKRRAVRARTHIEIDSGMGRTGFLPERAVEGAVAMKEMGLDVEGAFTHFATADDADLSYTAWQYDRFMESVGEIRRRGVPIPFLHACNSPAVVHCPRMHLDAVRPGNLFYGLPGGERGRPFPLLPSVSVKTALTAVRDMPARSGISYGLRYMTRGNARIGVIPIGFYDGFTRLFQNAVVLVRGRRVPVVGTICMDQTMVNLESVPEAETDDEVVIIGRQGEEEITISEVAERLNTIVTQVLSLFSQRVPRIFI